ncbi:hypothetical protein GKC32_09330 [Lactobacillus curvatus]|nr:hypothetical protein [Latilactobacillus curvatus]MSD84792.1 hypothetical protein [Latilactobacillus curvatus]MSE24645.1 hypothetical protein [Latilactobacillus curvatus]
MTKLTLDEKHRKLVDCINSLKPHYLLSEILVVAGRKLNNLHPETEELIAKIYLADEIEWIAPKYNWRLKSEKLDTRYVFTSDYEHFGFDDDIDYADRLTESEFKKTTRRHRSSI